MNKPFSSSSPCPAVLILGPTGSGKTPLGEVLAARGLGGRRCLHFDFGAELRRATTSDSSDVADRDRAFIRAVLEEGALLEPEDFPVAGRLLRGFLSRHRALRPGSPKPDPHSDQARPSARTEDEGRLPPLLILNGLPRHVDQAEAIRPYADIRSLVELRCTPETVRERIRHNSGGDRTHRIDDEEALVRKKLAIYAEWTTPLISFYRESGIPVLSLDVDTETTPDTLLARASRELRRAHGISGN